MGCVVITGRGSGGGCVAITLTVSGGSAHPTHNVLHDIEIAFAAIELHPPILFAPIGALHS
jgi:hypothetical protein